MRIWAELVMRDLLFLLSGFACIKSMCLVWIDAGHSCRICSQPRATGFHGFAGHPRHPAFL